MAKKIKGVTCITRNGSTYWYARVDGRRKYCGKNDRGYKLAVAARSKYIAKRYENREMLAGLKVKKVKFKNVRDLSNWYMELPRVQRQRGFKRKVAACVHLLAYFGNWAVHGVESDDIERYRMHRLKQGSSDNTVNVEVAVLSAMYHEAKKAKKIQADMMPGEFSTVRVNNPRRIITDDEFEALLKHAGPDFADFLICGHESSMRSSEVCDLRAYQVHLDETRISSGGAGIADYIDLGVFDTKTGAKRTVPVSPKLKAVLVRRMKGLDTEDRVFTRKGQKHRVGQVRRDMRAVCKKASVPYGDKLLNEKGERLGVTFHCLRHTRTTKWVEMGFSDEIIRRATGHRTLDAYRTYVKLDPLAVMRLVEAKPDTNGIKSSQTQR
jgi:integrase